MDEKGEHAAVNETILTHLCRITKEEQSILDGRTTIDRGLYMQGQSNIINAKKLLEITLRPHTRFIHFPEHTHDYVEMVYMCSGETTHIVNGKRIRLEQGNLLLLSQSATHEICRAEEKDVAVNFIVLPVFLPPASPPSGRRRRPFGNSWWTACAPRLPARAFSFLMCPRWAHSESD